MPIKLSKVEEKLLHYTGRAISDFKLIKTGDTVMACLSGGKDSFAMVNLLRILEIRTNKKFMLLVYILDQGIPGFDPSKIVSWLEEKKIQYVLEKKDNFSIVKEKTKPGKTFCSLCSRLRRGVIYRYARENNIAKIALGHHRDDLIETLLMSIFYSGQIRSMPPKLLTDDKKNIVIRPMVYCQEKDIVKYSIEQDFPVISKELCAGIETQMRQKIKDLIGSLATDNFKVPSNILHAIQSVKPSQLMDQTLWNIKDLEDQIIIGKS